MSITISSLKAVLSEILIKDKLSSLKQTEFNKELIPTCSTSTVLQNSIFIAIKGSIADGHKYISDAMLKGALCCIVEDEMSLGSFPGVVVEDSRKAFALLSAEYFNNPSKELLTFGVTGTNGKSTTAWMISSLLTLSNEPALLIGTIGNFEKGKFVKAGDVTTPDAFSIQGFLRDAVNKDLTSVAMEVSSHALDQRRCDKIDFNAGIFTNLTRDHLDYHGSFEDYFLAKRRLFELVEESTKSNKVIVINTDDEYGKRFLKDRFNVKYITFGKEQSGFYEGVEHLEIKDYNFGGNSGTKISLSVNNRVYEINSPFIGEFNVYNLVGALGVLYGIGYSFEGLIPLVSKISSVPGRLEKIEWNQRSVFVDYSHTPDALERALIELRKITPDGNKLWVVFGCGGDRDRGKRPIMGAVASRVADKVVVTSDNPRTEDPEAIIDDILSEVDGNSKINNLYLRESDRKKAIETTLKASKLGDVILIAGKGHEDYQVVGREKFHFSDQEVVRETKIT